MERFKYYDLDYIILLILGIFMIILVMIQVLNRLLPFRGFWTLELLRFVLGATVWVGISTAIKENQHISMDNLEKRLPLKSRKVLALIRAVLFGFYLLILSYLSWDLFQRYIMRGRSTPAMGINYAYVRSPIFFGVVFSLIRLFQKVKIIIEDPKYLERINEDDI